MNYYETRNNLFEFQTMCSLIRRLIEDPKNSFLHWKFACSFIYYPFSSYAILVDFSQLFYSKVLGTYVAKGPV